MINKNDKFSVSRVGSLALVVLAVTACKPSEKQVTATAAAQPTEKPASAPAPVAKPAPFDPTTCRTGDKKYVYWAAKDQVFRFEYDPLEPLYPRGGWVNESKAPSAQDEVPPAPNPNEPEGCFGNPLRAGSVPYMNELFDGRLFRKLGGRNFKYSVQVAHGYDVISEFDLKLSEESLEHRRFATKKICEERQVGVSGCFLGDSTNADQLNRIYKIDKVLLPKHPTVPDIYFSVLRDIETRAGYGEDHLGATSRILLFGNVRLNSAIRIFPNEIDLMLPYYSGLIAYVLNAHIPNYQWKSAETQ